MPDKPITELITDDRETEVNSELSKWPDVHQTPVRIDNGVDGIWDKDYAWQRKRGDDLVSSIQDGRMYDIAAQQQLYPFLVLIIEDKDRAFAEGRLPEAAIMGAVASAIYWKHCMTVYTRDCAQTALFIRLFGLQLHKEGKNHPLIKKKPALTIEEKQLQVLQSYEGIGAELSIRILAKYKTLWNFYNAVGRADIREKKAGVWEWVSDPDNLQDIERFGPALCYKTKKILGI